jgi:hypothetical protein
MRFLLVIALLVGCADAPRDDSENCPTAELNGPFDATGSCFGLARTTVMSYDADCSAILADWSPAEGGATPPTALVVTGAVVDLSGGDFDGCSGTIDGGLMSGTCPDDCAWELAYTGD